MSVTNASSHFTNPDRPPLIGALLRMPVEVARRRMLEYLHTSGFDDIEPAHLIVLQYPGPQGTRPTELAARLRISKQALNYLLGQLEARGYLERRADPEDLRSKRIHATDRGVAAMETMRDAIRDLEVEWGRALGAERFALLRELLTDLVSQVVETPCATGDAHGADLGPKDARAGADESLPGRRESPEPRKSSSEGLPQSTGRAPSFRAPRP